MSGPQLIVVVDDDSILLMLIQHALSARGYRVETASSGQQGLDRIRATRPAAVVLDMMMPDLSGLEVLRAMRAEAELARIPVILLTARRDEHEIAEACDAGAADYLNKPFKLEELSARIARLIGNTPMQATR
jgi:DNA-binding response OmpR family regulator